MLGNIFLIGFCIVMLFVRKDYYLRKNKKGKYTLAIPRTEREAATVIRNEQALSQIVSHKKKPIPKYKQYKSLTPEQLSKLYELKVELKDN